MPSFIHHTTCFALALVVAAAYKKSEVAINSVGLVNHSQGLGENIKVKEVVRRIKKAKRVRTSTFAGLLRTDRYSDALRNIDCNSRHGGADIDVASTDTSLEECKRMCIADEACTCISHEASTGRCSKQRHCYAESCEASSLADTYMLHTTLTAKSTKYNRTSRSWPQFSFERSGGRECTPAEDNVTNLTSEDPEDDLSVTQCLNKCLDTTGCKCVMYERYYQSTCFLKSDCPLPTFCGRSIKYDMYVHYTTPLSNPYGGDTSWMR
jgi:hypothetical protein